MTSIHINDFGDESTVVAAGLFIAQCIDGDGEETLRLVTVGDPKIWTQVMLAESALVQTKAQLKARWEEG